MKYYRLASAIAPRPPFMVPVNVVADIRFINIDDTKSLMPTVDRIIQHVHGSQYNHKSKSLIWELDELEYLKPYAYITHNGEEYCCEYGLEFKCYPENIQRIPCYSEHTPTVPKIGTWMKNKWLLDDHFNTFIKEDGDEPTTKILSEDVRGSIDVFSTRNGGDSKKISKRSRSKPENGC